MLATIVAGAALVLAGGTVIDGYGNAPIPDGIIVIEGDRILAVGGVGAGRDPGRRRDHLDRGHDGAAGSLGHAGLADAPRPRRHRALERDLRPARGARRDADRGTPAPAGRRHERARHRRAARCGDQRPRPRARTAASTGRTSTSPGPRCASSLPSGTDDWQWEVKGAPDVRSKVRGSRMRASITCCSRTSRCGPPRNFGSRQSEARAPRPAGARLCRAARRRRARRRAQFDGFLGTNMGVAAFPEACARAHGPARRRPAPADCLELPRFRRCSISSRWAERRAARRSAHRRRSSPQLVAADIKGSLASLPRTGWTRARDSCDRLRQLDDAKVLLLLGSDAGAPGHLHSRATWQEIDFWVRQLRHAGRAHDPRGDARRRNRDGRRAMSPARSAPGKIADIIAVRGDVLRDPDLLQSVDVVIKRGRRVR